MSLNPTDFDNKVKYVLLLTFVSAFFLIILLAAIYFFSKDNLLAGVALLVLPGPIIYLYKFFSNPRIGFVSVLVANYFAIGLSRYIPAPVGLTVDGLLFLTLLAVIFSQFNKTVKWKDAGTDYTYFTLFWFGMTLFQLINPEAISREAWFYAMRGQALYLVLAVPLVIWFLINPAILSCL